MHTHKLQRINPLAVSDPALMFGKVNSSSDFEDGIFTAYFRKANKDHSVHKMTTWLCLDAPLHQGWAEFLSSALDKGEVMTCLENFPHLLERGFYGFYSTGSRMGRFYQDWP